jgi:hypothetical protein
VTLEVVSNEPRPSRTEAIDDVGVVAELLQALGAGPDKIEPHVIYWIGKQLQAAYSVLAEGG